MLEINIEVQDLSIIHNAAYKLAELINGGHYHNIFYYEFHQEVDPTGIHNCLSGLESFKNRAADFYNIFIHRGWVDEVPAIIHIALKIGNQWFIAQNCGANYYGGYGPSGILKLRKACTNKNVTAFVSNENFEDWLQKTFDKSETLSTLKDRSNEEVEFEKLCRMLQHLTRDMQRKPHQFSLTEENIRDVILTSLNVVFEGRGHAESKNFKGKTDILIRTKDGLNEHIFELKIWKGIQSLKRAINQLKGYLSWHNDFCGLIIFSYKSDFTAILSKVLVFLKETYNVDKQEQVNEFRFKMKHLTDNKKTVKVHLILVNLKC